MSLQRRLEARRLAHRQARRLGALLALGCLLPAGLLWRFGPWPLPAFAFKYGGSALWAAAVYALGAVLWPALPPLRLGRRAALTAVAVECFKLVRTPALDRFRLTFAGKVLLGRYFTFGAIVAYLLAIAACVLLDRAQQQRTAAG